MYGLLIEARDQHNHHHPIMSFHVCSDWGSSFSSMNCFYSYLSVIMIIMMIIIAIIMTISTIMIIMIIKIVIHNSYCLLAFLNSTTYHISNLRSIDVT